ncbi:universal stress protein [Halobacteriaceae archaeon GCM10025711]
MTRRVLVAFDDSPQAAAALRYALDEYPDAAVTVLHALDPTAVGFRGRAGLLLTRDDWRRLARQEADDVFAAARAVADEFGTDLRTALRVEKPARAVVEYADEQSVDHVVIGTHGDGGVTRVLLGSVAESVVRESPVPVTVVG